MQRSCSCGSTETKMLDLAEHNPVTDKGYDATCTENGLTDGKHCSVCGAVIVKQTVIPKTGHDESDWIIDKQPTKSEEGKRHTECTRCHIKLKEETIAKLKKASEGLRYKVNSDGVTCTITGIGTCTDTDLVIPSVINDYIDDYYTVTSIGGNAFSNCWSLTSIVISDGVTWIGGQAFYSCKSLTSVTIGNGVTSISGKAFHLCTSLTEIDYNGTIEQWVKISIGNSPFWTVKTSVVHCKDGDVDISQYKQL